MGIKHPISSTDKVEMMENNSQQSICCGYSDTDLSSERHLVEITDAGNKLSKPQEVCIQKHYVDFQNKLDAVQAVQGYSAAIVDIEKELLLLQESSIQQRYYKFEKKLEHIQLLMENIDFQRIKNNIQMFPGYFPTMQGKELLKDISCQLEQTELVLNDKVNFIKPIYRQLKGIVEFDFGTDLKEVHLFFESMCTDLKMLKRDHEASTQKLESLCRSCPKSKFKCCSKEAALTKLLMQIQANILRISGDLAKYDERLTDVTKSITDYIDTAHELIKNLDKQQQESLKGIDTVRQSCNTALKTAKRWVFIHVVNGVVFTIVVMIGMWQFAMKMEMSNFIYFSVVLAIALILAFVNYSRIKTLKQCEARIGNCYTILKNAL